MFLAHTAVSILIDITTALCNGNVTIDNNFSRYYFNNKIKRSSSTLSAS
jgi:hypothetical protein